MCERPNSPEAEAAAAARRDTIIKSPNRITHTHTHTHRIAGMLLRAEVTRGRLIRSTMQALRYTDGDIMATHFQRPAKLQTDKRDRTTSCQLNWPVINRVVTDRQRERERERDSDLHARYVQRYHCGNLYKSSVTKSADELELNEPK